MPGKQKPGGARGGQKGYVVFHASASPYQPTSTSPSRTVSTNSVQSGTTTTMASSQYTKSSAATAGATAHLRSQLSTPRGRQPQVHVNMVEAKPQQPVSISSHGHAIGSSAVGIALERTRSQPVPVRTASLSEHGPTHVKTVAAKPVAVQPQQAVPETIPGFSMWLQGVDLLVHAKAAQEWAEEQGACDLGEIVENLEELMEALSLEHNVRARVRHTAAPHRAFVEEHLRLQQASSTAPVVTTRSPSACARDSLAVSSAAAAPAATPLRTAMSVPVTGLEQQAVVVRQAQPQLQLKPQQQLLQPQLARPAQVIHSAGAPATAWQAPPSLVRSISPTMSTGAASDSLNLWRTATGASEVLDYAEELSTQGAAWDDVRTSRMIWRDGKKQERAWTPPPRVPPNLLKVRVPEPEELHQIRNVRQAASELAQEVWADAEAAPKPQENQKKRRNSFEALRKNFLDEHGKAILKELGPSYTLQPADVSKPVQQRFLNAAKEDGKVDYGFHGTRQTNIPSILDQGLLVPGGSSGVRVVNGSAHGVGIYTALPGQSWLSKGFSDSANMLICGIVDPNAEPSPYKHIVEQEEQKVVSANLPKRVGEHRNHHKPGQTGTSSSSQVSAAAPIPVCGTSREDNGLKVVGSARILFNQDRIAPLYIAQPKGAEPFKKAPPHPPGVSQQVTVPANQNKKATGDRGGSGQVFVSEVGETFWAPPEEERYNYYMNVKRAYETKLRDQRLAVDRQLKLDQQMVSGSSA